MVMTKYMVSLDSLTRKTYVKTPKLFLYPISLRSCEWFYDMAAILDTILNFTPSVRDPDCPLKFSLLI